jgi:hypothetical protein
MKIGKRKFGPGVGYFDRDMLRRVILRKSDEGDLFVIITKWLDKSTLKTETVLTFICKESLEDTLILYLENFCGKSN